MLSLRSLRMTGYNKKRQLLFVNSLQLTNIWRIDLLFYYFIPRTPFSQITIYLRTSQTRELFYASQRLSYCLSQFNYSTCSLLCRHSCITKSITFTYAADIDFAKHYKGFSRTGTTLTDDINMFKDYFTIK